MKKNVKGKIIGGFGAFLIVVGITLMNEYGYLDVEEDVKIQEEVVVQEVEEEMITTEEVDTILEYFSTFDKIQDGFIKVKDSYVFVSLITDNLSESERDNIGQLILNSFKTYADKNVWDEYNLEITLLDENGKTFGNKMTINDNIKWR